jgi:glucokinase
MSGSFAVGVDLGGTKMLAGVVDDYCKVLYRRSEPSSGQTENALLDLAVEVISDALERHPEAGGVGLGIPCTIATGAWPWPR